MWRKQPPTVEEVTRYEYWWNRSGNDGQPFILALDVDDGMIVHVDCDCDGFDPRHWGEQWAPCIPPQHSDDNQSQNI